MALAWQLRQNVECDTSSVVSNVAPFPRNHRASRRMSIRSSRSLTEKAILTLKTYIPIPIQSAKGKIGK